MASQVKYGAAASRGQGWPLAAIAASHTTSIGRHQAAARYSWRGGQPRNQARLAE